MIAAIDPEPDQLASVIYAGQDIASHWLVQETRDRLEGRFISSETAMGFARAEVRAFPGARVALADQLLVPSVSFDPVRPDEYARAKAA